MDVFTASGRGAVKLGHPVPLSNLAVEEKSGRSQPAHEKVPARCSLLSGLLPERSVPWFRSTSKASGDLSIACSTAARYAVFLVSDLPERDNLELAQSLMPSVHTQLAGA